VPDPLTALDPEPPEAVRSRARSEARRRRRRRTRRIVTVIVVVSALAGALADGSPTGLDVIDVFYRATSAALVTAAASQSRRWTWFVLAGAAGAVAGTEVVPLLLAGLGLAVAFGSVFRSQRQRELGALVGLAAAQALLRLPTDLPFAVPTIAAALAPVPVYISALRTVRRPRRYLVAMGALLAVLIVIGAAFAATMFGIEDRAGGGLRAARAGVSAARAGDDSSAENAFARAEEELAVASADADSWLLAPARAVPVLAQHVEVVRDVVEEGRSLAALSTDQIATLDVRGLSQPGGGVDLERVEELAPRARTVSDALDRSIDVVERSDSPWLVAPVQDRLDEFAAELEDAAPAARNAADALELAPSLLGAERPQRYLVLVGNPAEAREMGGFVASVGTLTADRGQLDFTGAESLAAANAAVDASGLQIDDLSLPPPLPASGPNNFVQNWANTPDLEATVRIAAVLGPAIVGGPVDGVVYLDPHAIAALMEVTGPVAIEGRPEPLTPDQAVDYLLREQYLAPGFDEDGERKERLREAAEAAFDSLASGPLPDPRRLADVLSPAVRARRLLFTTTEDRAHPLLKRIGLRPPVDTGAPDQLLVAHDNLRTNKLDAYLERDLHYDVEVDGAGNVLGTVTVELTNDAPTEGLGDYVTGDGSRQRVVQPIPETTHRINLALYSRFEVTEARVDGERSPTAVVPIDDLWRTAVRVSVPAGTTVRVAFDVVGTVDGPYSLAIVPNAGASVDTVSVRVETPEGTVEEANRRLARVVQVG
jgi:hypothetical protein